MQQMRSCSGSSAFLLPFFGQRCKVGCEYCRFEVLAKSERPFMTHDSGTSFEALRDGGSCLVCPMDVQALCDTASCLTGAATVTVIMLVPAIVGWGILAFRLQGSSRRSV